MSVKQAVQDSFGPAAARYAASSTHAAGPDRATLVRAADLGRGDASGRLLDVGTGAGHTAFAFAPLVGHVEALDLTPAMLDQVAKGASERGLSNIACKLGEAEDLPYPDASFELVTCRLCAHHFQDVRAFAREAARVLRPAGKLLLMDSVAPEDAALDTFFNAFELLRDPSHVRNYSHTQWSTILKEAGFDSEVLGSWMLEQDFDDWVERIGTPQTGIAHLRFLFETAHANAREAFALDARPGQVSSVGIPASLIRATLHG